MLSALSAQGLCPECLIEPLHAEHVPRLVTVTSVRVPMTVYGYQYVRYIFPKWRHPLSGGERRRGMPSGLQRQI